jgi:hypothetical protein
MQVGQADDGAQRASRTPASTRAGRPSRRHPVKKILTALSTSAAVITLVAVVEAATKWN